uniref:NADH-ubiquinone oxidoreductase chain 3 n=1 Tax=Margaritifera margaritifera TaxID=2505931 RepID=A0A4Y5QSI0_9BIVA|nr:NADH dehydrogenase subunit 3 [Margaritifera margaritifera]
MELVLVSVFVSLVISFVLLMVGVYLSFLGNGLCELSSPFECGFDPVGASRLGFSLRFFLLAVFFVVFDFETVLLMPSVIWLLVGEVTWFGVLGFVGFLALLLFSLLHEIREGCLEWKS